MMRLEYVIKCSFFYKEMASDGAKSKVAKWNLIGRTQAREKLLNVHAVQ